jgi:hypothetical protein
MSNPPAGWYPDPTGQPNTIRWWNGTKWTNKTEKETGADGTANQPADPGSDDQATASSTAEAGTEATAEEVGAATAKTVDAPATQPTWTQPETTVSSSHWTQQPLPGSVQREPAQPVQPEPLQPEPTQPRPAQPEFAHFDSAQSQPAQSQPAQSEPAQSEPAQSEPVQPWSQAGVDQSQAAGTSNWRTSEATPNEQQTPIAPWQQNPDTPWQQEPITPWQQEPSTSWNQSGEPDPQTQAQGWSQSAASNLSQESGQQQTQEPNQGWAQQSDHWSQGGAGPNAPVATEWQNQSAQSQPPWQQQNQGQTGYDNSSGFIGSSGSNGSVGYNGSGGYDASGGYDGSNGQQGPQNQWPPSDAGQQQFPPPLAPTAGSKSADRDLQQGSGSRSKTPLLIGGAVALVLIVVAGVFFVVNRGDNKADPGPPATQPTDLVTSTPSHTPTSSSPTPAATPSGGQNTVPPGQSKNPKLHEGARIASDAISFPRRKPPWSDRKRFVPQLLDSSGQYVVLQENFDGQNDWYADVFVGGLGTSVLFNGDPQATASDLSQQLPSSMYGGIPITVKPLRNGAVKRSGKSGWYYQQSITANSPKVTARTLTLTVAVFDLGDGTAVAYVSDIPTNRADLKAAESQAYKGINVG